MASNGRIRIFWAFLSAEKKKAIWSSNRYANDERLVITEAVIDAFSYHALFGNEQTRIVICILDTPVMLPHREHGVIQQNR